MPRCPRCRRQIDHLIKWVIHPTLHQVDEARLTERGAERRIGNGVAGYYCPNCDHLITVLEDRAIAFLKGGGS